MTVHRKRGRPVLPAAVGLLVLGACGSEGLAATGARDRPAVERELTLTDIEQARKAWAASAPDAYRYEITRCFACPDDEHGYVVTVVGSEVVSVDAPGAPAGQQHRDWRGQTVEEQLDMFEEAVALADEERTASSASAAFDPDDGRPTSFTVRWDPTTAYAARVTRFEAIDPDDVTRPDHQLLPITVSNQSFEHPDVRITVVLDGEVVIDADFPVGTQHTFVPYAVPVTPGVHELRATSDTGAELVRQIEVGDRSPFLYFSYWGGIESGAEPLHLDLRVSDEPFGFG